jgi:hypothetical protein
MYQIISNPHTMVSFKETVTIASFLADLPRNKVKPVAMAIGAKGRNARPSDLWEVDELLDILNETRS